MANKWQLLDMAKKQSISENLQDVLKRLEREKAKERRKVLIKAGQEYALLITWMKEKGIEMQGDVQACLASVTNDDVQALKEVLAYYDTLQKTPKLATMLLHSFNATIIGDKLRVNFNWHEMGIEKLKKATQKLNEG